jgi:hypothetical protein
MRKFFMAFVAGALLVGGTLVYAQGTATPAANLVWDQPNVANAVEAQAMTYYYYADGAVVAVVLSGVVCAGSAPVTCQVPFPAFTPGTHTLQLSAANAAGEGPKSAPPLSFTFVVLPSAPTNVRIQ